MNFTDHSELELEQPTFVRVIPDDKGFDKYDIVLLATSPDELQDSVRPVEKAAKEYNMISNVENRRRWQIQQGTGGLGRSWYAGTSRFAWIHGEQKNKWFRLYR